MDTTLRQRKGRKRNFTQDGNDALHIRSGPDASAVTPVQVIDHATPPPVTACTAGHIAFPEVGDMEDGTQADAAAIDA